MSVSCSDLVDWEMFEDKLLFINRVTRFERMLTTRERTVSLGRLVRRPTTHRVPGGLRFFAAPSSLSGWSCDICGTSGRSPRS
jgi:hypothetical protein